MQTPRKLQEMVALQAQVYQPDLKHVSRMAVASKGPTI